MTDEIKDCVECDLHLHRGRCYNINCEYFFDVDVFLKRRAKELIKNALAECLRANYDDLRDQAKVYTRTGLKKLMDGLETTSYVDDVNWHAGYIAGLQEAVSIVSGEPTRF